MRYIFFIYCFVVSIEAFSSQTKVVEISLNHLPDHKYVVVEFDGVVSSMGAVCDPSSGIINNALVFDYTLKDGQIKFATFLRSLNSRSAVYVSGDGSKSCIGNYQILKYLSFGYENN